MTFPKNTLALAVMAATVSLAATPVVFAETVAEKENKAQSKPVLLQQVTVTATRAKKDHADVVQNIDVIDLAEIEQQQASSVPELMESLPNVSVSGGPRGSAQGVNIRGLEGTRVLQVMDGARQNFSNGHRGTYFTDPELLKSVEVVKGPSSSLWGSGAIGGVVVQNTKSAQDLLEEGKHLGGYVSQGYHSNNSRLLTSGAVYGMQGDIDWLLNGYYNDGENYELGNGQDLEDSGSREQGGMAKLGWNINGDSRLEFKAQHALYNGLVPSNPTSMVNDTSILPVERDSKNTNLSAAWLYNPDRDWINSKLQIFRNDTHYEEDRVTKGQKDDTRYKTNGLALTNISIVDALELTYGLDVYQNTITTERDTTGQASDTRPEGLDGQSETMGAFVQGSFPLSQSWELQGGLRYDHFSAEDNRADSDVINKKQTDQALSPSLGIIWTTTDWLTLTASYNEAFRAPGMEEMFSTGTHFAMGPIKNVFVPNPDLKPEEAENKEISARMEFSNLLGDDELRLNANIFKNDVDNFINQFTYDPAFGGFGPPTKTSWENVEEAELKGFEIAGEYRIQNIEAGLSYGQTRGEDKQSGEALGNIPADKVVADLAYLAFHGDVKVGTRFTHVNDQNRVDPDNTVDQYEGYDLVDFYASYEPAAGSLKGLKADFTIKNATDKYYRVAWQELYQPGRSYRLDLRYMF
ncbi:TonB-dependent hemoglobin/transferrin/lactoferrin family receptor [Endozoicomonas sp. SCSIO W0465]|uniref:TonB-dependent hemoglobin/transferrin/lactoferrin family receptor n=1 Tax=Endozoicomonas sp. SCSIO W0465 TaxID=2918516 RepID=UPI0020763716|nr:TonB-dependent hemoglobin/transferrin/lactoferrin family receptor [Endozoicomonas sp. SCSIO W0465]USE35803.1 TonB-dependent hemoglobin/transferrin/lactoferrin family receptor [Endozoicomonas sp. SCSIO W0465]